jgi:hypothetical protein
MAAVPTLPRYAACKQDPTGHLENVKCEKNTQYRYIVGFTHKVTSASFQEAYESLGAICEHD